MSHDDPIFLQRDSADFSIPKLVFAGISEHGYTSFTISVGGEDLKGWIRSAKQTKEVAASLRAIADGLEKALDPCGCVDGNLDPLLNDLVAQVPRFFPSRARLKDVLLAAWNAGAQAVQRKNRGGL